MTDETKPERRFLVSSGEPGYWVLGKDCTGRRNALSPMSKSEAEYELKLCQRAGNPAVIIELVEVPKTRKKVE